MKVSKKSIKTQKWKRRVTTSEKLQRSMKPARGSGNGGSFFGGSNSLSNDMTKMLKAILKNESLTPRQKNRRVKQVMNTLRDVTNARVKTIAATGHAIAENVAPTAITSIASKSAVQQANDLISGGASYMKNNTTDKRSNDDSTSYGDER